jgi:hypothetical protein
VWRTGWCGSPVTIPLVLQQALRYIVSVNLLTATLWVLAQRPRM